MMNERKTAEFVTKNNNQWIYAALASGKGAVEGDEKKNEAKAKPEVK